MQSGTAALAALADVWPMWTRVVTARYVVHRPGRWLLHAGPPFQDPTRPSLPVLNAATIACIHEGWAATPDEAEALIKRGAVLLAPAQDHGVVLPLASVASPRTTLVEVADANCPDRRAWSLLASGASGPQIRFGTRDLGLLSRLAFRDEALAAACRSFLSAPVDLFPLARAGLAGGDDLHGRTSAATAALARHPMPEILAQTLATMPLFFLTLWMAACACMALALTGYQEAPLVTALCGNGERTALRRADRPGAWVTAPAEAPFGPLPADITADSVAGMIGDSGIIDAMGFGGQAVHNAPELIAHFGNILPTDDEMRRSLYVGSHPFFEEWGIKVGLDAGRVAATGVTPLVVIAMLRRTGGLAGRGLYRPPVELFTAPSA